MSKEQKEFDKEIREELSLYLKNQNNSISGNNLNDLITNLQLIQERWKSHCQQYINNLGRII